MASKQDWIPIGEATREIFGTSSPTPLHQQKVSYLIARGVLVANHLRTHVTTQSVATYVASCMEKRRLGASQPGTPSGKASGQKTGQAIKDGQSQYLTQVYQSGMVEYLSGMIRARRRSELSPGIRKAVLVSQVGITAILILLIGWIVFRPSLAPPAELDIVRAHLQTEPGELEIIDWSQPKVRPDDSTTSIDVRIQQRFGGRIDKYRRTYIIKDGRVVAW